MTEFSYEGAEGPSHWSEMFPDAKGKNQSPIDILAKHSHYHKRLRENPLYIYYEENLAIKNTGHSFQIYFNHDTESFAIGGPVKKKYKFLQMHMHWGVDDSKGSEHAVDGEYYSAELHFVNWNYHEYDSPGAAMESEDHVGLLVFGVFAKVGEPNPELDKIIKHFQNIHFNGDMDELPENINWRNLFPSDIDSYYTYLGSLTTPPCTECACWVVFKEPIELSHEQLCALRTLSTSKCKNAPMMCNDRPICHLDRRKVFKSFH